MDTQDYTILFIIWLLSTLLVRAILSKIRTKSQLPPSPISLPIIGHLHLLRPIPHQALHKLSQRFGPLFHLSFGSIPCLVVSSPEMAKEFLKTHELSFCNRPSTVAVRCLTYGASGFSFAPYGPYWRFMKQICMTQLLGGQTLDRFLELRRQEIDIFLKLMLRKSYEVQEVNLGEELMTLSNNIISRMTMSKRCSTSENEAGDVRKLIEEVGVLTGKFNFQDYIWFCKNIDVQGFGKRIKKVQVKLDAMMESILEEHEEARMMKKNGGLMDDNDDAKKDLVDIMLDIMEDESSEMTLSRESVKAFILEMFTTGTGTSAGVIQWAMAELINNPNIFNKARQEIDSIVGTNRLIEESDIPNLPYLQAILKETLRLHPSGPLFTRESTQDCTINGGYIIPAKTRLLVNVWAIGRDPNYWENPLEFNPERFMTTTTTGSWIDFRGQHYHFLPFGSGRRSCPGISLALQVVETTVGCMVQCFDWKVNNNRVDMNEAAGISLLMANPMMCVPVARLEYQNIIC
ncbi:cytochrome P450 93A3-like [Mercurialis annua]|uniref:cytochrome P450 93A3-like n=1 Tax=Mercurialis annua TaxID=3986 RepID=UPI00215DFD26|nr:cytochrome P450 93A3-like [Mercurialis annua]